MLDRLLISVVGETLGEPVDDSQSQIQLAQQQPPCVGAQRPAIEMRYDSSRSQPLKMKLL
jgi:hypothetical protein